MQSRGCRRKTAQFLLTELGLNSDNISLSSPKLNFLFVPEGSTCRKQNVPVKGRVCTHTLFAADLVRRSSWVTEKETQKAQEIVQHQKVLLISPLQKKAPSARTTFTASLNNLHLSMADNFQRTFGGKVEQHRRFRRRHSDRDVAAASDSAPTLFAGRSGD